MEQSYSQQQPEYNYFQITGDIKLLNQSIKDGEVIATEKINNAVHGDAVVLLMITGVKKLGIYIPIRSGRILLKPLNEKNPKEIIRKVDILNTYKIVGVMPSANKV